MRLKSFFSSFCVLYRSIVLEYRNTLYTCIKSLIFKQIMLIRGIHWFFSERNLIQLSLKTRLIKIFIRSWHLQDQGGKGEIMILFSILLFLMIYKCIFWFSLEYTKLYRKSRSVTRKGSDSRSYFGF